GSFQFHWENGKPTLRGHATVDVDKLAEIQLWATNDCSKPGSGHAEMEEGSTRVMLSGKLTAKGLQEKLRVGFAEPPEAAFWVTAGEDELDYGMSKLDAHINRLPVIGACDIHVKASYSKDRGLDGSAELKDVHLHILKLSGGLSVKE